MTEWDGWSAWRLDWLTVAWIVWIAAFVVLETIAILTGDPARGTLTHHLRPVFGAYPVMWFVGLGVWLWLGVHFLAWRWEMSILEFFRGA